MTVTASKPVRRQPSYPRKDALAEADVTPRQESYWRKVGLFTPELGGGRYTAHDIRVLRLLKQLIEVLGMPVATVQQIMESVPVAKNRFTPRYLNIWEIEFADSYWALSSFFNDVAKDADDYPELVEHWLLDLALRWFHATARRDPTPEIYKVRRDLLIKKILGTERASRARYDQEEEKAFMWLPIPGEDDDLTPEEIYRMVGVDDGDITFGPGIVPLPSSMKDE